MEAVSNTKEKRSLLGAVCRLLGFYKNNAYIANDLRETDVQSARAVALVVLALEIAMVVRYIIRWVIPGKCETVGDFFYYTRSYWYMIAVALAMYMYSVSFLGGRIRRGRKLSVVWIFLFFCFNLYFGIVTAINDFSHGRMITCFLSMVMFITFIVIWRPCVSLLLVGGFGWGFVLLLNATAVDKAGNALEMSSGDLTNYITFLACMSLLAVSTYHQRHRSAVKSYELAQSAITDDLTGIPNIRRFDETAREYQQASAASGTPLVYLAFNLDNFQTYNDRFGYGGGDQLLEAMGRIIVDTFPGEPCARQDNDHFAVLTRAEGYEERAARVRDALRARYSGESYLDVKVGVYRVSREDVEPRHALDRARNAGKLLKNDEGAYIREYDEKLSRAFHLRQYVLNNIDTAVKNGYIKVYYQPVIWSRDGSLCGAEALARWDDPEMGFLSPGQFIPILEECRQIHKLDRCIYETVCRKMRECLDSGLPVLPTSLNFSRLDFELMDAVGELEALVQKYDIPRKYLHVEITESALTSDEAGLQKSMQALREKGYALWLDDFGSGYSSMNVLKDFRFDLLKIDMVFLRNFAGNENARKIIRSILDLAGELNMMTLTEGVESEEAIEFLQKAGCGRLQGYYFGKPMIYEDILARLKDGTYKLAESFE